MNSVVGYVTIVGEPKNTKNLYGEQKELGGLKLPVWERNSYGDCLSYWEGRGLVDVDACDVEKFDELKGDNMDPMELLRRALRNI